MAKFVIKNHIYIYIYILKKKTYIRYDQFCHQKSDTKNNNEKLKIRYDQLYYLW